MADLDELKAAHEELFDSIERLVDGLDADDWDRPTGCPGWSVRDVLAHVVGLEAIHLGDDEPDHELPADLPHVRDDFGRYMEVHVDARRRLPPDDLRRELRVVLARRRAAVQEIGDLGEEVRTVMGGAGPAARVLSIRVLDLWMHEQDIRRAAGRPGHHRGPAVDVSLRRIDQGVVHYLPQRLEGEDRVVVLEVDGEPSRTVSLDLGTGESPATSGCAAARLRLGLDDYVALAGGRADAPAPDQLAVEGDAALAERVVASLAITP